MSVALADIRLDPPVFLAPLAGITDLPFRRLVAGFGAGLVVSEMVASAEVLRGTPLARARAELGLGEAETAVQLVGRDPYWMAMAAQWCADQGARIIDINFGCPARRVTATGGTGACGSALMREPDLARRLIAAVVAAVSVPVTVKMRLGWDDDSHNAAAIATAAAEVGAQMVTVHGRTRCQFYRGAADWAAIRPVVAAVPLPVIANGDIRSAGDARAALVTSGAAGVMAGRGAQGRPWLLAQIAHTCFGHPAPIIPQGAAFADLVCAHYEDMLAFYGRDLGGRVARKHLGWYLDTAGIVGPARREVLTTTDPARVIATIRRLLASAPEITATAELQQPAA